MARTADQYRDQLKSLLPPGRAITREPGANIDTLLDGLAQEWARLDAAGLELAVDVNPLTTLLLLPDWERAAGLPDDCIGELAETLQDRRADLVARLSSTGGQSAAYFIEVAAALGYTVTITEFRPFRVGQSAVGDALTNGDWIFAWRVNAPETTITSFRVGQSAVGEPLRAWGNERLECAIEQLKPAHTILLFGYS
jgi:uncharacterized protein YmfQ (DUF2313 family)